MEFIGKCSARISIVICIVILTLTQAVCYAQYPSVRRSPSSPAPQAPARQQPQQQAAPQQQQPQNLQNLKVLEEYSDGKGNIVRVIQYTQGHMKITETIIMPKPIKIGYRVAINPDTMNLDSVTILVYKSAYNVQVKYRNKIIRSYKAVFGPRPADNKTMEGDRNTPEGWFKITNKNPASKYNKFMLLNYPNDSSYARFNKLKSTGAIPSSARIGGSVGIHGIWEGGDNLIDLGVGWTDGCVALKNSDVTELYTFVGVGTRVYIKK